MKPFETGDRVRTTLVAIRMWADAHMTGTVLECTAIGGIDHLTPVWRVRVEFEELVGIHGESRPALVNCCPDEIERLDAVRALAELAPAPPEAERGGKG